MVSDGVRSVHDSERPQPPGSRPSGVTSALLNAKVDTIIEMLAEYRAEQAEHDDRIRALETDSARMKERVGLFAVALACGQLIGSGIAVYIASLK